MRASLNDALLGSLIAIACAGCSSLGVTDPGRPAENAQVAIESRMNRGEPALRRGIKSYEDADYKAAVRQLQSALRLGLAAPSDEATAYKYLAFVACTSGREKGCQAAFRKAFAADPGFRLAPAEAGHPIWGPVFRSVREELR